MPAAGKGSRLAPFPAPKELFPVGYQDFPVNGTIQRRPKVVSQYLIENIRNAGVEKFIIILGEGKSDIMRYYSNGKRFGLDIAYLYQDELKGMPHALSFAENWIENATVVFGMPDTIIEPYDYFKKLLTYHENESADLSIGLFETNTPQKFGMVAMDENSNVVFTIDKPKETELTTMWGCACWSEKFTILLREFVQANQHNPKEIVLGDAFNLAIEKGLKVKGFKLDGAQYIDIGTSDELDIALKKFHL